VQTAFLGLLQADLHDLAGDAVDLDVHLQGGEPVLAVPATLKSMSPRWSSSPRMSVSTANLSPSLIRPMAIPATGALIGTPASISARLLPQTLAMELEPLDSVISDTTRMV
jgi:hypothetical protein